ncbi:hypothetical protein DKL61_05195 [Gammaproteobacteria bacterium ESL0073]|nr:hypothetical protein DKL61_05195 [Gammaproteobacteria bacterium ESL0073]
MRYTSLFLIIFSVTIHAQMPPASNIPNINYPPVMPPPIDIEMIKLDLEMAKFNKQMAKINSINVTTPNGFYGGNEGISFHDLGMTSQSFGKVLSSISMSSNNYNPRYKVVVRAQPDATSYIISNGKIRGAYLEQALILLRKEHPNTSDMALAKAILAY